MTEPTQPAPNETTEPPPSSATVTVGEHPNAGTVLILAIVGIIVPFVSFIAWYMGARAKKEIANGAPYYWGGQLRTGYLVAKIYSILVIVSVIAGTVAALAFFLTAESTLRG